MALAQQWIGWTLLTMALTAAVVTAVQSSAWLRSVSASPRSNSNEDPMSEDCPHPKRMMINNVIYCLSCQSWLPSGRCLKCREPLDQHVLVGVETPVCPKAGVA